MKRGYLFFADFSVAMLLSFCILICGSCEKETQLLGTTQDEGVPIHLSVSLNNDAFSTDSEVVPMRTRQTEPYTVAWIYRSKLLIIKKVQEDWILEDIKENPLIPSSGALFRQGDKLTLNDKVYILRPGTYKFILFVNAYSNSTFNIGSVVNADELVTASIPIGGDAFLACSEELIVEKTDSFNKDNINSVELKLERRSCLVRIVLENEALFMDDITTSVNFEISSNSESEKVCVGMNALGQDLIQPLISRTWQTDFSNKNRYQVASQNWYFPLQYQTYGQLRLYADDQERYINITISRIGNLNSGYYPFEGAYTIERIPVKRNHITVIVIRTVKTEEPSVSLSHELNPEFIWDNTYPPFDYIELNNN